MNKSFLHFIKDVFFVVLTIMTIAGCNNSPSEKKDLPVKRDKTITETNAYSSLELDSMMLENYIFLNHLNSSMAEKCVIFTIIEIIISFGLALMALLSRRRPFTICIILT
jgi:hypothetical protein